MKNSILGGYAVTVGYPEPVPLGDNDNISLTLQNTIFAFNGLDSPTGLWIGEGVNLTSQNCIYYSRDFEEVYLDSTQYSVTREDINNGYLGNNFGVDPEFVSESDFHLKPTSPAIDAGIPAVGIDIEHNLRPYGNGYDIGCYEYVEAVNQPPFAEFTNQPLTPFTGEIVTFDASQSSDDSIITLYTWDFGDGSEETTSLPVITHVYSQPGLYVVTLTVTDNSGLTSSKSKQITVQEAGLADLDSDGWSDFAEVAAGTDPRDVSSYPSIQQKVMRVLPSIDSIANEFNVTLTINGTVDLIVELIPENFTFVSSTAGYQIHDNRVAFSASGLSSIEYTLTCDGSLAEALFGGRWEKLTGEHGAVGGEQAFKLSKEQIRQQIINLILQYVNASEQEKQTIRSKIIQLILQLILRYVST